jgi:ADP-dependent NAD(P)H-hydrate dehydratase / NAD(P)H-hydrate epimerase
MKIFSAAQMRSWGAYTIQHEPVTPIDLMHRAVDAMFDWFSAQFPDPQQPVVVVAGTGNNGGDGLGLAAKFHHAFYDTKVLLCPFSGKFSPEFEKQKALLPADIPVDTFHPDIQIPADALVIDAMFGTGLDRPLTEPWAAVIQWINALPNEVVAIDMPSGLPADVPLAGPCVQADYTVTIQAPKRALLFPENYPYAGEWTGVRIGLLPEWSVQQETPFHFITPQDLEPLRKSRSKFAHKGNFGHALLVAGSFGKVGAALLSARACLRAGAGLLTVHAPLCAHDILQAGVPEAMYLADEKLDIWSKVPETGAYAAVGVGPGIGTAPETEAALYTLLEHFHRPMVLDADALNILALHPKWWRHIPQNSILTPHPKEFERLFGPSANDFERNQLQRQKAEELGVFIVLKGAHSAIATPDGQCWFNSSGNPGMATGGSGDVLTGILTGLLAQGYAPLHAALLGVYLHGLAGDLAAEQHSEQGLIASDMVEALGAAWLE